MQEDFEKVYLDLQRECLYEGARIVSMGVWIYDFDKKQVHWSDGVFDVYGLDSTEQPPLLNECLSYFIEKDAARIREEVVRIQDEVGSYDIECELVTRAGVRKFVRVIGRSGSLLAGCTRCLFGVIQDVSETRQIRDALIEARDQANAANRAKSNFLATVSHELRTPLNPILGFSDILLEEVENEEQLEMVRSINEAGQNLVETINRILEFAELNPDKLKLSQDRFLLSDLVDDALSELAKSYPSFSVHVEMGQELSLPGRGVVIGDYRKVKCVLLNLLGNAAKFSGAKTAKLGCLLRSLDAEHVLWHVDVEDSGAGIHPEMLDQIFDPFLMGDATYTRRRGGSGMGLAISRGYVELMDGRLTVQSKVGEGATFSFFICLSIGQEPVPSEGEAEGDAAEPLMKDGKAVSILMVEDSAANLYYQTLILEEMGCELTTATNGRQALDKYQPELYDLILLDLHMPGIDGLEVLKSIRQREAQEGADPVAVIVLTADLLKSTQAACREYGADVFVSKPVNSANLKSKIIAVLSEDSSEEFWS